MIERERESEREGEGAKEWGGGLCGRDVAGVYRCGVELSASKDVRT